MNRWQYFGWFVLVPMNLGVITVDAMKRSWAWLVANIVTCAALVAMLCWARRIERRRYKCKRDA